MKINFIWKVIIPSFIILIFFLVAIQNYISEQDLKKNGIIVHSLIQEVLPSGKATASPGFKHAFNFEDKEMTLISYSSIRANILSYAGKTYPALYAKKTNSLVLLITDEDYKKYGIKDQDILK